ncbi:F-BOX PROTEIN SKIP23 [Salix purpurea]|uniref:F-BOX PROTEIN SKIP23 n=1 Tax=Salix purpurea TaxID=77065 RepID=A0A9Q0WZU9_SALPP|nr:F-BOX PROTEIN SKIP23 [Salix purpurea]
MSRWADLPKELLEMISKRLDSGVDALRFRAVCTSWRCSASLPSFDQEIPPLLLMLPQSNSADSVILRTTVWRMELVRKDPNSSSLSKSWLVKVGESKYGKLHLLNPLTNQKADAATSLDFLDFKFVRLSKAVFLKWSRRFPVFRINKDDKNFQYDDIMVRKDQFYVIDRWGTVSWIHPSLKVIQYCPSLYGCGGQKNLVESCGDLYVVGRYLDGERRTWEYYEDYNDNYFHSSGSRMQIGPKAVYFRVYKLDEERGTWVDVKSLDDRVFVLGMDCSFSISCREFSGGIGNCIYFVDGDDFAVWGSTAGHVFQLEDRSIEKLAVIPEFSEIFWPPNAGSSMSTNLDVYV